MGDRAKVFLVIALFGFIAGIIADLTAQYLIPLITEILPDLLQVRFIISGIAGAVLTVALISIWAYLTRER